MAMYAGAAALGAAVLLSSQKQAQVAASGGPAGPPPVWARMRWTDLAWQLILPYAGMHPPAPPGQVAGVVHPQTGKVESSGVWLYWPIGADGFATSNDGHQEGNLQGQAGNFLYVWFPRNSELQNINGYWIYHQANHHKPPPPPPPSAPPGKWSVRGGNRNYLVWITSSNVQPDSATKQFAWFTFHKSALTGAWHASKVIATSAPGVSLPDETDPLTGKMLFLLTPQQAQVDAAVLQLAGNSQPPQAAPPPDVAVPADAPSPSAQASA
jgi:hypothetical protein